MQQPAGFFFPHPEPRLQARCGFFQTESRHLHHLHAGPDGGEQLVRLFTDKKHHRPIGRFLDELEHFVGRIHAHGLRQPEDEHLPSTSERLQSQLSVEFHRLLHADEKLLSVRSNGSKPLFLAEVGPLQHPLAPRRLKGLA